MATRPPFVFELKVVLRDTQPPIWRQIHVSSTTTLAKLHRVLQVTMGWTDSHLHEFDYHGAKYGVPDPEYDAPVVNERSVRLDALLHLPNEVLTYLYDFGDSWEHSVILERISQPVPGRRYPLCVAGDLRCPPEDCGSTPGYYGLLEALADRRHEQHEELLTWVGGRFDPAEFSPELVTRQLHSGWPPREFPKGVRAQR